MNQIHLKQEAVRCLLCENAPCTLPKPAPEAERPSLEVDFCGLHCENPFFLASSAVCTNYEMVAAALEAGWAGVFYKTICLQDIDEVSPRFDAVKRADLQLPGFVRASDLDRTTVVYPVIDRDTCIGCGRCHVSCRDGGHQAITFGEDRQPRIVGTKCVGCHLCYLVCPTGAIGLSKRVTKRK